MFSPSIEAAEKLQPTLDRGVSSDQVPETIDGVLQIGKPDDRPYFRPIYNQTVHDLAVRGNTIARFALSQGAMKLQVDVIQLIWKLVIHVAPLFDQASNAKSYILIYQHAIGRLFG